VNTSLSCGFAQLVCCACVPDFSNVDIMGETNMERLGKLGNLMDRTVTQKATGSDLLDASIPLPPPPPPPLPGPPQHTEDEEPDSDNDDDFGLEDEEEAQDGGLCGIPRCVLRSRCKDLLRRASRRE
jgi:hypothetical protein